MGAAERAQLIAELSLDDKFTKPLNRIDKRLGAFSGAVNRNLARGIDSAASAVARGVVRVGKGIATAAIDWEDAFQGVVKTVTATPEQFDAIAESIRAMSREMPIAATELAAIAEAGGQMGIKANDIAAFTKQVAILGATTNLSTDEAAMGLGQMQTLIGLTGDEFDNFAASLVALGAAGTSTEGDILEIARRAGGAAKLFGIAKEDTLGWAAAVANLGVNAELGGTALQNVFLKLLPKVSAGSEDLRKTFGKSDKQIQKMFRKDATGALQVFVKQLAKMPKDARLDAIQGVFGKGAGITRVLLGLTGDVKKLDDALKMSSKSWFESSAAQKEFDKRNATVRSAITRMRQGLTDAAVTVGEGFVPALGRAADKLSKFLSLEGNRNRLKEIGEDIGKAIDGIDFDRLFSIGEKLASALKPAASILVGIAETIGKLPPELLGAGGALVVTNQITGGLAMKGIGGAFSGLGESIARSMATSIPFFGRAFVQHVWVDNMAPGGPGGPGGAKGPPAAGVVTPMIGAAMALDLERFHGKVVPLIDAMADARRRLTGSLTGGQGPGRGGPANGSPMKGWAEAQSAWIDNGKKITDLHHGAVEAIDATGKASVDAQGQAKREVAARVQAGASQTSNATTGGASRVTAQSISNTSRLVGAIQSAVPSVSVVTNVNVSAAQVVKSTTTQTRYGRSGGSAADDDPNGAGR